MSNKDKQIKINTKLLVMQIGIFFLVLALFFFLPAGTLNWSAGWIALILFYGFYVAVTIWMFRQNPGLLLERMTGWGAANRKGWDKVLMILMGVLFCAWLLLMPLDAVRFQWSQIPIWLQVVGVFATLGAYWLCFLAFRENSYLSPGVRIQEDRGQEVISTGPYRYVRHPMYAAAIPMALGMPLLLGSWYGIIPGLFLVVVVAGRAVLEEHALRQELKGYDVYMTRVKYRLIPYIW